MLDEGLGGFDEEAVVARQSQELSVQVESILAKHFSPRQPSWETCLIQDVLNKAEVCSHLMISSLD
jgi:hypothetical protein